MRRERRVIESSSVERGGRGRIWRKGHYNRQFKEERDSGNILLFQTYIKHDRNTPSDRKLGEKHEKNGKKTKAVRVDRRFTVKVTVYFTRTVM